MKPFRKSLPPHLLRLNPKATSATSSTLSKQTKPIFSSSFPNPNPTALSQTTAVPREDSISLLKLNSYHELSNTHLWNSSHQSKSVLYDPFSQRIIQARSFSVASSVSLSKPHINHEFHHTHFFKSIKEHKFVSKTIFSNPFLRKFHQARAFSTGNSNPDPEPSPGHDIPMVSTVASPFESSQPIDAGSSMRKPISLWPGMYHSPVTNALWEARSKMYEKAVDKPIDTVSQSELVAKSPSQSRTSILYKFSTDYTLKEQYRNPWNEVRMGKLVEDLDALAGTVSYKHCCSDDGSTMPILLVTASVDRMVLNKPIHVDSDLKIVGAVTWVGRSSMEIQMEVIQSIKDTPSPSESAALVANFTFVARDSKTGRAAPVNQILPETEHEKLLWKEAEERNKMRKQKKAQHKGDTQDKDIDRLYALLAEGRIFCDMPALADRDSILIKDTYHENSLICQPQQRNIHGRIFGGFLMRKAFELAFSNAYAFAGAAPRFVEVDHVDFLKPVDVGSFLRLKSCVLYTQPEDPAKPLINVEVIAHVTRPELRSSEVSNKFYFTFTIRPEAMKDGLRLRNVVPATEEEARRVLERIDAEEKS